MKAYKTQVHTNYCTYIAPAGLAHEDERHPSSPLLLSTRALAARKFGTGRVMSHKPTAARGVCQRSALLLHAPQSSADASCVVAVFTGACAAQPPLLPRCQRQRFLL